MFRKEVNGKVVAAAVVVILAAVQFIYWRLLVYHPTHDMPLQVSGAPPPPVIEAALGLEDALVDTLAGDLPGYVDGPGWKARFSGPNALAFDRDGSLLVCDSRNHRLRRIAANRAVSTVAGSGPAGGFGGKAEGPAAQASFRYPSGVAVDAEGVVYLSDTGNHRICRLKQGLVTVLAQGRAGAPLRSPAGLALGPDGALWVLDAEGPRVLRVDMAGGVTIPESIPDAVAAALGETQVKPRAVRMSAWSHDEPELALSKYAMGRRSAGSFLDRSRRVYADMDHGLVLLQRGSEAPALLVGRMPSLGIAREALDGQGNRASFSIPAAVAAGRDGSVFVADYEGNRVRRVRLPQWLLKESPRVMPRQERRWSADDYF